MKTIFSIASTKSSLKIFNNIFNISEQNGRIINNLKISKDKIYFSIKDDNPFAICEFLTADQISNFMQIIEEETQDN